MGMMARHGLILALVATLLAGTGCVNCGNRGYSEAHKVGPTCDIPTGARNQVFVFAIGGLNPVGIVALEDFRTELNRQGFAKIATGQTVHAGWMSRAMRTIRQHEPDAVFVVLGSDSGGPTAVKLSEQARADGVPVVAVVLLDTEGKTPAPTGMRTLTLGSGYGNAASSGITSVTVSDASRFRLPCHPQTIAAVTQLLNEIAMKLPQPATEEVTEWSYPLAPPARPTLEAARDLEWAYLYDAPGGTTRPIGEPVPTMVAKPAAPVIGAAPAVAARR